MEGLRKVLAIRRWEDRNAYIPRGPVLVEVPREWASAVLSLVRISEEYRHNGLIVTNIAPGSQGASAGLARGDVLLRYDGMELDSAGTLKHLTKRHTQGAGVSKTVTIEAARGAEDVSFEVHGGRLGITVSPSLHRLKSVRGSLKKSPREAGIVARTIALIHRLFTHTADEHARWLDPSKVALVEVPGELMRPVLFLVKSLGASGASQSRKMAKALLSTAAR
jgi:PDZ domain